MKARVLAVGLGLLVVLLSNVCDAANRIVITPNGVGFCGGTNIYVFVENDEDLSRLSIPLVARALGSGNEFWADSVRLVGTMGRLSNSLTGTRYLDDSRVDFVSPDPFVLYFEASGPGDCLPAGPYEPMIELQVGSTFATGLMEGFEIDTMASPPCTKVQMLRCSDQAPMTIDQFSKGWVMFYEDGLIIVDLESDAVTGMAGAALHNQVIALDPEADPIGYKLLSGPGDVDAAGLWTWGTRRQDPGDYTVVIDVFQTYCGPGSFMSYSFPVTVTPHPEGDLNCDGQSDALDLAELIDHLFAGDPLVPCPE